MKKLIAISILFFSLITAEAKLHLPSINSDGMVLQQNTEANIWGRATPGTLVTVIPSWDGKAYRCKADAEGRWQVAVSTPAGGYKAYTLTVKGDGEVLMINDVLIGEVWMASGQSNMEMPMRGFFNSPIENAAEFIASAPAKDKLRMITVPLKQSYEPLDDFEGSWKGAESATIPDMSAVGYFFARKLNEMLDIPVGIVSFAYGGARVESWTPKEILQNYPDENLDRESIESMVHYHRPYLAYNAMLCPVKGYTTKGFIWYQGCSNVGRHEQFPERMSNMIGHWRECWDDTEAELPFYMVEIAPYRYDSPDNVSYASYLRVAQHDVADQVPNCGTVVTNDLVDSYEAGNIHPTKKEPIGNRLAYLALNRNYGFHRIACYSPRAVKWYASDNGSEISIELSHCPNGLNRWEKIKGLEIAGSDGVFYPVTSAVYGWDKVLRVKSEKVPAPCQVRYGWGDFNPGNLKNVEGLPVVPFWIKLK